jgi:hypothetical protein
MGSQLTEISSRDSIPPLNSTVSTSWSNLGVMFIPRTYINPDIYSLLTPFPLLSLHMRLIIHSD